MNVYDWYLKVGGTFLYCQVDDCGRRFRKYSRFRRHMNRKHLERE